MTKDQIRRWVNTLAADLLSSDMDTCEEFDEDRPQVVEKRAEMRELIAELRKRGEARRVRVGH